VIGPDNIWTDANDARVCVYCMTMGASWNARLDVPIDDAEALETLDNAKRKEFLQAIERDSSIADQVIADAAAQAESGLITRVPTRGITIGIDAGESMTVKIEREANRVLAERRAKAAIPPGRRVPGLGETTEGLIYEPKAGRKAPQFVSVVVAQGVGYRVIRRRGKYIVQTLGGRAVDNVDSLALALLLFALLEKRRRDAEKKREEAKARNG
jgi:hypothetical protein